MNRSILPWSLLPVSLIEGGEGEGAPLDENGQPAADADDNASDDSGDQGGDDSGDQLGEAGTKALERMKAERKQLKSELRQFKELGLSPEEIRNLRSPKKDDNGDDAPDLDQVRAEVQREATEKANARILRSEVKAAAAGKLADPADAHRFLDLSEFEVDADGNVDETEIADAIADLIKSKPYLAVQDGRRFKGDADGGARKESRPAQLSRDDLSRMSPGQIETARKEGRLNDLLGVR